MNKIVHFIFIGMLLLGLILGACEAPKTSSNTVPAATTDPNKPLYGGTLKIITSGLVNMGCPWELGSGYDYAHRAVCVENLLHFDETGMPIPWLATSWQFGPDNKSVTFALRKGVKFHDGTDFNATAVKFNLDKYRVSPSKPELRAVTSIDVVDDYTVRLNLSGFDGQLINALAGMGGNIVSPTAWQKAGTTDKERNDWAQFNPVGTGPFLFISWAKDSSVKFKKFDGYWQKGKPYLDALEFILITDKVTSAMAFKGKEGLVLLNTDALTAKELKAAGYSVVTHPIQSYGIAGDGSHPESPFAKLEVRQAVEYAIDKQSLCDALGFSFYQPAYQAAFPKNWWYNPAVKGYPYNPSKAKELLVQAGYPNGFKTDITFPTSMQGDLFTGIQGYLKAVGIEATITAKPNTAYNTVHAGGWNNSMIGLGIGIGIHVDPGSAIGIRLSEKARMYISVIHPPAFESKLAAANNEPDLAKRKAAFQELMKLITDEYCMYNPVFIQPFIGSISKEVRDSDLVEKVSSQWAPENTWISK